MSFVTNSKLYLKQKFNAGDTSFKADRDIGTTSGRIKFRDPNNLDSTYLEWVSFSGVVNNGDGTWTYSIITNGRNMSLTAIPSTGSATGKTFSAGSEGTLVAMHDQLLDPSGVVAFTDFTVSGTATFNKILKVPIYTDTVARDTAITSPTNGMEIYVTSLGCFQDYVLGVWSNRAAAAITTVPTVTETQFESIITGGDSVGQLPDGIYKVQQEVKTSTALGGANTYHDHCQISTGKYVLMYSVGGVINVVVSSISSTDAVTYGSPVAVATVATPTAKMALIGTNKFVLVYSPTASASAVSVVGTVSGTVITLGGALTETMAAVTSAIASVFKVRTDCYGYANSLNVNPSTIRINTVSGTTCTTGTTIATYNSVAASTMAFGCYLSDNYIAVAEGNTTVNTTNVYIYNITGGGTTVANTYTGTMAIASASPSPFLARYSDSEVVITNAFNTERSIYTIPGAGTVLTKTTLTVNAAANYKTVPLLTGIYGINTGSSILIYQKDALLGTITSTPAYNTQGLNYDNGRILFFNGATLIPSIANLARVFSVGIGYDTAGKFTIGKNFAIKTGIVKGYRYYQQADGTLTNTLTVTNTATQTNFFGRGVLTDRIMIEI